jgi:hypothetical protein
MLPEEPEPDWDSPEESVGLGPQPAIADSSIAADSRSASFFFIVIDPF